MKITLKKFSFNAALSEETYCFSADLYIDGKKRGCVSNRGHGEQTRFSDYDAQKQLDAYGASLPPHPLHSFTRDGAFMVDLEVGCMVRIKEDKKMCKKGIVFIDPAEPDKYSTYAIAYTEKNVAWVKAKHSCAVIINEQFGKPLK